ncbi:MAG: hypothetical protein ACREXS_18970 [Gammaproteobacteria bacterium]
MKFLFSLTAALLSLGLAQPALSATLERTLERVLILQCSVAGTAFVATAGSDGRSVRNVDIGNSCARELEEYLEDGFTFKSTLGDQSASIVTYTLIGPR